MMHGFYRVIQFQVENIWLLVSISQYFSAEGKTDRVHRKLSILIMAIRQLTAVNDCSLLFLLCNLR